MYLVGGKCCKNVAFKWQQSANCIMPCLCNVQYLFYVLKMYKRQKVVFCTYLFGLYIWCYGVQYIGIISEFVGFIF